MAMATATTTRQHNTPIHTEHNTHTLSTLLKRNSLALSPASQTTSARLTRTAYGSDRTEPTRLDLTWSLAWHIFASAPRASGLSSLASSRSLFYFFALYTIFFFFFFCRKVFWCLKSNTHQVVNVCVACRTVLLVGIVFSLYRSLSLAIC